MTIVCQVNTTFTLYGIENVRLSTVITRQWLLYSMDTILVAITRNSAMRTSTHDIELRVVHLPGSKNIIADNFSCLALGSQYRNNLLGIIHHRQIGDEV